MGVRGWGVNIMRMSLIALGIIFFIVGGFFFFIPLQSAQATTTTVGEEGSDTRVSYATISIPRPLTYVLIVIGLVLSILGFTLPGARPLVEQKQTSTTETSEDHTETRTEDDEGRKTHKVSHVRHSKN